MTALFLVLAALNLVVLSARAPWSMEKNASASAPAKEFWLHIGLSVVLMGNTVFFLLLAWKSMT